MEDGNNFGVSVQMIVAKYLKDEREAMAKTLATFPDYFDKRAGAVDKLSPSSTTTSSTSSSTSTGGKDGDEKKESASASTEQKKSLKEDADRANHVCAIDVQ